MKHFFCDSEHVEVKTIAYLNDMEEEDIHKLVENKKDSESIRIGMNTYIIKDYMDSKNLTKKHKDSNGYISFSGESTTFENATYIDKKPKKPGKYIEIEGKNYTIKDAAIYLGFTYAGLNNRLAMVSSCKLNGFDIKIHYGKTKPITYLVYKGEEFIGELSIEEVMELTGLQKRAVQKVISGDYNSEYDIIESI